MKRGKTIKLRLRAEEYSAWEGKARAAGMTLSEWIRRRCASAGRPKPARAPVVEPVEPPCVHRSESCGTGDLLEQKRRREEALEASSKNLPVI
jgi:hypothetical protein